MTSRPSYRARPVSPYTVERSYTGWLRWALLVGSAAVTWRFRRAELLSAVLPYLVAAAAAFLASAFLMEGAVDIGAVGRNLSAATAVAYSLPVMGASALTGAAAGAYQWLKVPDRPLPVLAALAPSMALLGALYGYIALLGAAVVAAAVSAVVFAVALYLGYLMVRVAAPLLSLGDEE